MKGRLGWVVLAAVIGLGAFWSSSYMRYTVDVQGVSIDNPPGTPSFQIHANDVTLPACSATGPTNVGAICINLTTGCIQGRTGSGVVDIQC